MVLKIQDKRKIVDEVHVVASRALSMVIADPSGMKGYESIELRKEGRKNNVYVRVIRNTLISKILYQTPFECFKDVLFGPTLIGFSIKEPSDAARLFQNFGNNHEKFKIKVAVFENKVIPASQIDLLSNLPTFAESIIRLIFYMQKIAVGQLINVLSLIVEQKK
ncbi:50S ribosomal protein L10 [Blochmannia endosymbiont of Camponotus (Colobopsis) obliquus]|uniref:50S ribosomal protein L10 n=1 Tax=Blochmannia endosymbiont of Camponotus (Colobopsis) obliquus TaxID=1505597 RepID=UPI00061A7D9A|nr:50S ribosomal protein L10 [Blochmannia endosymbiont of Camponotus (Colobopsis) obliquus]AKC60704.1 50S ribosomal protein L10 [Blochmannia endosymbiont of Camponotus (Colobopsis) obliquus]